MRTGHLLFVVSSMLIGCVEVEDLGTDMAAARAGGGTCSTCDNNGLDPDAMAIAPLELAPPALGAAGILMPSGIRPLCEPGTITSTAPTACTVSTQWWAWASADYRREALLRYMVKVSARQGDLVWDPTGGSAMPGGFAQAPTALDTPWSAAVQSKITAGLAATTDYYANAVAICMKTADGPDCPASYRFQELAFHGNLFAGQRDVAVGGYAALVPTDSRRVCPGFGLCNTYSAQAPYYAGTCSYGGPMGARYPISCSDPLAPGAPRPYVVQIFMETDPATFGSSSASGSGRPML